MPPEILALLDKPVLLLAVLGLGAVFGIIAERITAELSRPARRRYRARWPKRPGRYSQDYGPRPAPRPALRSLGERGDAADQLRIVMAADFTVQPLLNKSEARLFRALDQAVIARNPAWQVMAQVSLGEVLNASSREAYGCINSKRVDLLLMDGACQPRHVIEYQGGGHYQGSHRRPGRD